jgi:hypothetical protein
MKEYEKEINDNQKWFEMLNFMQASDAKVGNRTEKSEEIQ